jgi:hypothetical protein
LTFSPSIFDILHHFTEFIKFAEFLSEGGSAGGFKGGCQAVRAEVPPSARERGAEQKILLILLEEFWWRAQNQNEGQNFLRGAAAAEQLAGGGLFQIPLFGFMYQIWQNDFKSMPRSELVLLRGLRGFGFGNQVWRYELKIFR